MANKPYAGHSPGRQRKAGQLAFLPTKAEERRAKRDRERRERGPQVQCFSCRRHYPPDRIRPHEETGEECCTWCEAGHVAHYEAGHVAHYEAWLSRQTERLAREAAEHDGAI